MKCSNTKIRLKDMILFRISYSRRITHNITLLILGFLSWGIIWCTFGEEWGIRGQWFRLIALAAISWTCGRIFESLTNLPPCLAMIFVGIIARNTDLVDIKNHLELDIFIRKLGPVIILGKASLAWDTDFMVAEWRRVVCLGILPWLSEVLTVSCCTHFILGFPWIWGFLLGSIYSSLSCGIVIPSVVNAVSKSGNTSRNWPQLVCTAGGLDTGFSVGVFGLLLTYIFVEASYTYKVIKAVLTLFVGVILGVSWGSLSKFFPHKDDQYVEELRVLFVFFGGLFGNFITSYLGWGGTVDYNYVTGGVAVLACNMTAAMHWKKEGKWKLNKNPAATAYRVMFGVIEPIVCAFTGTHLILNKELGEKMLIGLGIIAICLVVRLSVTNLVCWDFTMREKLFISFAWTPQAIVEILFGPLALVTLLSNGESPESPEAKYAEDMVRLLFVAVIVTTPLGFLLTNRLGPRLLSVKTVDINI